MADTTVIGRSAVVRGRVTGSGDLEIVGRVEGEVTCTGEVTVEKEGLVAASISARRIVIRGAVKGDLTADAELVLESGARVVGDLRGARITIAAGGLVKGHVQTGAAGASKPRSTSASATQKKHAPPPPVAVAKKSNHKPLPRGAALAGHLGRPAPVVPALKRGTKATHKKSR
jgi:cytoskeletal protein CcmA (bactofilin family)